MFENVNIESSIAVYLQIENLVRFAIASGELKAGDKLPSAQELAKKINVNMNTVAKAYRDLEVMGLVYTRRGMGVYVNKGIGAKCNEDCRKRIMGRLHEVVSEAKAAGMSVQDIKEICKVSLAAEASPYGETPANVLALAKKKAGKK